MTVTIESAPTATATARPVRPAVTRPARPAAAARPVGAGARRRPVTTTRSRVTAGAPSCVAAAPQPIAASSAVQLTRRGWTVLLGLAGVVAAVLVGLAALSHAGSGDTSAAAAAPVPASEVVVQPGDTLWSIAERVAPGEDPRAVVYDLQQANHLTDPTVVEGQVLHVG